MFASIFSTSNTQLWWWISKSERFNLSLQNGKDTIPAKSEKLTIYHENECHWPGCLQQNKSSLKEKSRHPVLLLFSFSSLLLSNKMNMYSLFREAQNCRVKKTWFFFDFSLFWRVNLVQSFRFRAAINFFFWHYCLFCTRTKIIFDKSYQTDTNPAWN